MWKKLVGFSAEDDDARLLWILSCVCFTWYTGFPRSLMLLDIASLPVCKIISANMCPWTSAGPLSKVDLVSLLFVKRKQERTCQMITSRSYLLGTNSSWSFERGLCLGVCWPMTRFLVRTQRTEAHVCSTVVGGYVLPWGPFAFVRPLHAGNAVATWESLQACSFSKCVNVTHASGEYLETAWNPKWSSCSICWRFQGRF